MLRLMGMSERGFLDWPLTDQSRSSRDDPSPMTWPDYTDTRRTIAWAPGHDLQLTLKEVGRRQPLPCLAA